MQVEHRRVSHGELFVAKGPLKVPCGGYCFVLRIARAPEVVTPDGGTYAMPRAGHNGMGPCWSLDLGPDNLCVIEPRAEHCVDIRVVRHSAGFDVPDNYCATEANKPQSKSKKVLLCN